MDDAFLDNILSDPSFQFPGDLSSPPPAPAPPSPPLVVPEDIQTEVERECRELHGHLTEYIQRHDEPRVQQCRAIISSLPQQPYADVFGGRPLQVKNHMLVFQLQCEGGNKEAPLAQLTKYFPNSRIPARFMALIYIPPEPHSCSVLLFKSWSVISTGGKSLEESLSCIQHFLGILYSAMRIEYGPSMRCFVRQGSLKNRMSPNKVKGKFIDIISLCDEARACGLTASCIPSQINNVTVRPFPEQFSSLAIMFFPTGGVNIMGGVYNDELTLCEEFIQRFLPPFLRKIPPGREQEEE